MSAWELHVTASDVRGGYVWLCKGHHNCYENIGEPGYKFHFSGTHDGPIWRWDIGKAHWWQRRKRTLEETMDLVRNFLSALNDAEAMAADAVAVEKLVREITP